MSTSPEELPIEDLPVRPLVGAVLHDIRTTRKRPELKQFTGKKLFQAVREGALTPDEADIIRDEVSAKYKLLSMNSRHVELDLPEPPTVEEPVAETWSPTQILDSMPPREFDARERAAGEHLDR